MSHLQAVATAYRMKALDSKIPLFQWNNLIHR
jgi:hypothetical protein